MDVDVLSPGGLGTLEEEQILRVLSRNKTSSSNNFTLIELIGNLRNHTIEGAKDPWKQEKLETTHSNPFYGESFLLLRTLAKILTISEWNGN